MKKLFIALALFAALASCGAKQPEATQTGTTAETATENASEVTTTENTDNLAVENGHLVEVYYTLHDAETDGKLLDANMDADGNPLAGKSALPVSMGAGGVIPGFEKALLGMRVGETKSVAVAPEDGYTAQTSNIDGIDYQELAPKYTITEEKTAVLGVTRQDMDLSELNASLLEGREPGDVLSEHDGAIVKLIAKTDTKATLEFVNTASPFYQKELTKGMSESINGFTFTITDITENNVTFDVINTNSPFYTENGENNLTEGATTEVKQGEATLQLKILKIHTAEDGTKTVDIEQTIIPELAGKTLYFTIKVSKITTPNK